jgi:predicted transposase/invertase (TIGR01784 family)
MLKLLNLSQTSIPCSVFSPFQGEFMPRTKQPKIIPSALIPGTQLPRPTIDLVFKTMLQNNLAALKSLITAVLQPESLIDFVTILSPELHGTDLNSKQSRLDLHVKLHDGTLIDIEMQSSREAHFVKRSVYYTFQMIGGALKKGDAYQSLPNLAGIYIFDDVVFPSLTEVHSSFQLRRALPDDGFHLQPNLLRLDFIELPKISALNPSENPLFSAWVQFLSAKSAQDIESAARAVPEIGQLVGELTKMSSNKEFVNLLNKNEMDKRIAQLAQAEALSDARQEGQTLATLAAVQKVLSKRLKLSTESYAPRLATLSATKLAALHEAALDFQSASDLEHWLEKNS